MITGHGSTTLETNGLSHPKYITSSQLISKNGSPRMNRRRREVRFAVIRISLYVFIPILTVTFVALHELTSEPPSALTDLAMIMPALNGIFNFVVFIINPALDHTWRAVFPVKWTRKVKQFFTFSCLSSKDKPQSQRFFS